MQVCVKSLVVCKSIHINPGCINVVCDEIKLPLNNHFGADVNYPIQLVKVFIF
jgi:hypothetical protein